MNFEGTRIPDRCFVYLFHLYSALDMEASRQQNGLSYEKRIVQGSRSRRLLSTREATEWQIAGKLRIPRLVKFKLLLWFIKVSNAWVPESLNKRLIKMFNSMVIDIFVNNLPKEFYEWEYP